MISVEECQKEKCENWLNESYMVGCRFDEYYCVRQEGLKDMFEPKQITEDKGGVSD